MARKARRFGLRSGRGRPVRRRRRLGLLHQPLFGGRRSAWRNAQHGERFGLRIGSSRLRRRPQAGSGDQDDQENGGKPGQTETNATRRRRFANTGIAGYILADTASDSSGTSRVVEPAFEQ
jgi:hypothetical protein